ncbi:MAG TPA: Gldg family protein [Candidatus Hydrogenedentes bacterium]|nr:Gldg family protein [Candidatus Hydrogenedentota bacterium]HQH51340.1 Gldg family protein [Candidatus Hydrogenedentota bacterium]
MKNIKTVVLRDLGAYFTSPVGYIFVIVFLAMSVGIFMTSFFTFPVADMRNFFANLPIILCVFIPAVTMRVWAEERKENTWELLLTFPMRARELVLGKFIATLVFYVITLAATFTVPLMLVVLGDPDRGVLFGGYMGATLLGAMFLAMGLFFSGFCKDQIVAFVVTLLACFAVFLVGTNFIAGYIDGFFPGLGSALSQMAGLIDHYNAFIRGVVEVADVLYFLGWTTLFLVLNALYIEGRSRPGIRLQFGTAIALCLGIGMALNWLTIDTSIYRFDLTEDQIYTVSPAAKRILSQVKRPVQVNLYITPKSDMPTAYTQLEQDIMGKLKELRVASNGMIAPDVVYLQAANVMTSAPKFDEEKKKDEDQTDKTEKRMLEKGVEPFGVQVMSGDEISQKLIYSSIGVGLGAEAEEIIPQVTPETVQQLEYRLINIIFKLTREKKPVVALVAPKEAYNIDPQMRQIMMQMGQPVPEQRDPYDMLQAYLESEKYDVQRIELTKDSPLPQEYDTLAIINPRQLDERQRWEIDRALASGKSVILAVQNYLWEYRTSSRGITMARQDENPQVNELLEQFGLGVDDDLLMDVNSFPLTIRSNDPLQNLLGGGTPISSPMHIEVTSEQMDNQTSITSRLGFITYLWGTALTIDQEELKKHGLEARVIMQTSDNAWTVAQDAPLSEETFEPPAKGDRYPLMALVTGQFPDIYKDQPRPDWPPPQPRPGMPPQPPSEEKEEPAGPLTPAPGKLVLVGASQMFRSDFLQRSNADLFLNSIDAVTLGDDLVNVRSRKAVDRTISKPSDSQVNMWKFVNYVLVSLVITTVGVAVTVVRRQSRNAYTMSFMNNGAPAD